jgi:transmembrane sensor
MKYTHYKLEDFLLDKQFIEWVSSPDQEANLFWENWIKSNPGQLENVQKAKEIILSTEFYMPVPEPREKQELLSKILKGYRSEYLYKLKKDHRRINIIYKIAASFILMISVGVIFLLQRDKAGVYITEQAFQIVEKSNPPGRKSQIKLPDGTMVRLNSASSVSFTDPFMGENRTVVLVGEAFFEVKEDAARPFIVKTNSIKASVLGTSFNINDNSVALLTGKVTVSKLDDEEKSMLLSPGQKAVLDNKKNTVIKSDYNYLREIGWKDGIIYFEDASFMEIKKTIEKWYGVEIFSHGSFDWTYTGSFDNVSLQSLMERLAYLENFSFEINKQVVKIYNKNN